MTKATLNKSAKGAIGGDVAGTDHVAAVDIILLHHEHSPLTSFFVAVANDDQARAVFGSHS